MYEGPADESTPGMLPVAKEIKEGLTLHWGGSLTGWNLRVKFLDWLERQRCARSQKVFGDRLPKDVAANSGLKLAP